MNSVEIAASIVMDVSDFVVLLQASFLSIVVDKQKIVVSCSSSSAVFPDDEVRPSPNQQHKQPHQTSPWETRTRS